MKEKLLHERALVTCIAMLFICIILKLFGVQWFNLNTDIPILQEIDKVVMNSVPLSFLYSFVFKFINGYLIIQTVTRFKSKTYHIAIIVFTSIIVKSIFPQIGFLYETLILLMYSVYVTKDYKTIIDYVIVFILCIIYQISSLSIRGIGLKIGNYGVVVSVLLNLDYYIMLYLTYIYMRKGGYTPCSMIHHFGSSLANLLWKKRSENYSNKEGN